MAKNSVKLRDLAPVEPKPYGVYSRLDEYLNLLMNALKIERTDGEPFGFEKETFVKKALLNGSVGYDKITDQFYYVAGADVNEYGNPKNLKFKTANGKSFTRVASYEPKDDGAYYIKALPYDMTMVDLVRETTDFMTACDVAIRQNVEACKTPFIVVCKNDELRLSYWQALKQKQDGQAVLLVNEDLGEGLKAINISVNPLFEQFARIRDTERDELLTKIGILTANTDKKERVQSAEVNASLGQATDYIYLLIDTFNKQAETYELPFEMSFNGSMESIYIDGEEEGNDIDISDADASGKETEQ